MPIQGQSNIITLKASPFWSFRTDVESVVPADDAGAQIAMRVPTGGTRLVEGDPVCVFAPGSDLEHPLGCGYVSDRSSDRVMIRLIDKLKLESDTEYYLIRRESNSKASRRSASVPTEQDLYTTTGEAPPMGVEAGFGAAAGSTYAFPALFFRFALDSRFELSLKGFVASTDSAGVQISMAGGSAGLAYHLGETDKSGWLGEAGMESYFFSADNGAYQELGRWSPGAYAEAGWQWHPKVSGFTFRISLGAQYVKTPSLTEASPGLHGLLPLLEVGIGYAF
jgi:hypothetical protein